MERAETVREGFSRAGALVRAARLALHRRLCAVLAETLDPGTDLGARAARLAGRSDGGRTGAAPVRRPSCAGARRPRPGSRALSAGAAAERGGPARRRAKSLVERAAELGLARQRAADQRGRSAVLMSGLLVAADRFRLPLRLFELGASAGLNLQLDRYGYDLGGIAAGDPGVSAEDEARMERSVAGRRAECGSPAAPASTSTPSTDRRARAAACLCLAGPAAAPGAARGGARHRGRGRAAPRSGRCRRLARAPAQRLSGAGRLPRRAPFGRLPIFPRRGPATDQGEAGRSGRRRER